SGINSTALGNGASASAASSMALGTGAQATKDNQVVIGTGANIYATPGITSNASIVGQSGLLSVVTTDANGNLAQVLISNLNPPLTTPCQELVAGAIQCGTNAKATGDQSSAFGQASAAAGTGSSAVGF